MFTTNCILAVPAVQPPCSLWCASGHNGTVYNIPQIPWDGVPAV